LSVFVTAVVLLLWQLKPTRTPQTSSTVFSVSARPPAGSPTSRCRPATTWPWATLSLKTNKKLRATWHFSDSLLWPAKKTRAKLKTPVTLDRIFPWNGGQLAFHVTLNYAGQGEEQVTGDQKMQKQIFPPPST